MPYLAAGSALNNAKARKRRRTVFRIRKSPFPRDVSHISTTKCFCRQRAALRGFIDVRWISEPAVELVPAQPAGRRGVHCRSTTVKAAVRPDLSTIIN